MRTSKRNNFIADSPRYSAPSRSLTLFSVLSVSALMGALFGAICLGYSDGSIAAMLENAEKSYFEVRKNGDFAQIMLGAFASTGFYLIIAFMLGFSAVAQPFELLLPFFKGLGSGVLLAQIYGNSPKDFSAAKFIAVFPAALISLIVILFASREAVYLSSRLFKICFKGDSGSGMLARVKLYGARFLVLIAIASIAAAAEPVPAMLLL